MQLDKKLSKSLTYQLALVALDRLERRIYEGDLTLSEFQRFRDVVLYQWDHLSNDHQNEIFARLDRLCCLPPRVG